MFKHPYRGSFRKGEQVKAFHFTDKVKYLNHHWNCGCLDPAKCKTYHVDIELAYYLHYRIGWKVSDECQSYKINDCIHYDPIIYQYKSVLEQNMIKALVEIFL